MAIDRYISRMRFALLLLLIPLSGCEKVDRLLGVKDNPTVTAQYVSVACCLTTAGNWPASVPQDHIDLCRNPPMPADNVYYTLKVEGCGEGLGYVGDEYY